MTHKNTTSQRSKSMKDRFMEKVSVSETGCWMWTSARLPGKYGVFWVGGSKRNDYAHRVSYKLHKGEIPDGMVVMHTCDNMLCVNPSHLVVGTQQDNYTDSKNKGRTTADRYPQKGSGNFAAKIDEKTAWLIKSQKGKISRYKLSSLIGVKEGTINMIWRGKTWAHV